MNRTLSSSSRQFARRLSSPGLIVTLFVLAMSACVLGLVVWKAAQARTTALAQNEIDVRNLAHSLAEHATHTIQAAEVAMNDLAAFLGLYRPVPERLNQHLRNVAASLPQIDDLAVYDSNGSLLYASLLEPSSRKINDRPYFIHHRDHSDSKILISGPMISRASGVPILMLSKRLQDASGRFAGVVIAPIATRFFGEFYNTFRLGDHGSIVMMTTDGRGLIHWPSMQFGTDLSDQPLFRDKLPVSPNGYYRTVSPFDGLTKYFGYERLEKYPLVVAVAQPETNVLVDWQSELRSDMTVAGVLLCSVILLAVLLSAQLNFRARVEKTLREREANYRLLADNIADVVVVLDSARNYRFVSQSVTGMLGRPPEHLIGTSCYDYIYPDDVVAVKLADAQLTDTVTTRTIVFRVVRADDSIAWIEANFKRASSSGSDDSDVVAVLRDVTHRKAMEDQLNALNSRLAEMATTDCLTGLANRRTLDVFLRREFASGRELSVLLLDIDHFKGFNDSLGHQAGDECLKRVAKVLSEATAGTPGLSARYGGEEFALILPGTDETAALKIAEAVRRKVQAIGLANPASEHGNVTVSIGVVTKSPNIPNEIALLGEADHALYAAKRRGRNCCVCGVPPDNSSTLVPEDYCGTAF